MGKFLSGLGMGMVAGACVGLAAAGMMSEADRRQMKRKAKKAAPLEAPVAAKAPSRNPRTSARPTAGDAVPRRKSRPSKENRPKPRTDPYAHSRPVKKGKGSFRKKEQS